jgi:hypothetical protein
MTVEQSFVGALGCASWRSHYRLSEHAALAPVGGTIQRQRGSLVLGNTGVLGLNEVGVTDLVMATIWRCGPNGAAFAISQTAEANHLGADIAFLRRSSSRILLYQAKLARLNNGAFELKSKVTTSQVRSLRLQSVELHGSTYQVTGRLALYQTDLTPFIDRCSCSFHFDFWWHNQWLRPRLGSTSAGSGIARDPELGRSYYEEVLRCGCSPSGVLATGIGADSNPITKVDPSRTWPWEFDVHEWIQRKSPLDGAGGETDDDGPLYQRVPNFQSYQSRAADSLSSEEASEIAYELANRLELPASHQLYVVVLP